MGECPFTFGIHRAAFYLYNSTNAAKSSWSGGSPKFHTRRKGVVFSAVSPSPLSCSLPRELADGVLLRVCAASASHLVEACASAASDALVAVCATIIVCGDFYRPCALCLF